MVIAGGYDPQNDVPFVTSRARHIAQRLIAAQSDVEHIARQHALKHEFGADEGHGADLAGNVDVIVGLYGHVQLYPERLPV